MTRVAIERFGRTVLRHRWIAAVVLALTTGAAIRPESNFLLVVRNDNVGEARVFVRDGGNWKHVGAVRSGSAERFEVTLVDQSGAPMRLLARVGRDSVRAGPLTVLPGQSIHFTLHEDLSRSTAVVR